MIPKKVQVLIIDDESMWQVTTEGMCRKILTSLFNENKLNLQERVTFFTASTISDAKNILSENKIHVVLLDKDLGLDADGKKLSGINFISELKSLQPLTQIIVLTSDTSPKDIAQAIKAGATNYLFKSADESASELRHQVIKMTLESFVDEVSKTKSSMVIRKGIYSSYICESPSMQRLDQKLMALSETSRPVLILGATGLGKGAAARRLSEFSRKTFAQDARDFVQLNIAATEKTLVDAILFGTEPGAFTDASKQTKAGLLDVARDGDIFLDEIGDASLELQLKLLKVVEEKEYYRVGGNRSIKTNARFIFATNKDLRELVAQGKFREDLYMRISVFEVTMPSLAERKEDIPSLVAGFLFSSSNGYKNKKIEYSELPQDLIEYFKRDEIPGNIRGLENDVERLVAHSEYNTQGKANLKDWKKTLGLIQQSLSKRSQILGVSQLQTMKTNFLDKDFPGLFELSAILERRLLQEVSDRNLGVRDAAKLLKISVNTLLARQKVHASDLKRPS